MLIYRAHIVAGEFLTLLGDHLEEALKGTRQAKLLLQEFGGELLQQVLYEADGVRRVSERKEAFLQIELPVKGHPSILRAFDSLLEGERLEGENAYQLDDTVDAASGRKVPGAKVDAQKRICLGKLPSTLILQLKRFELDYETMANLKLNSECAFPSVLDLGPYTKRGVEAQARGGGARAESPPAGGAALTFEQLVCGLAWLLRGDSGRRAQLCFECFDADGSGVLDSFALHKWRPRLKDESHLGGLVGYFSEYLLGVFRIIRGVLLVSSDIIWKCKRGTAEEVGRSSLRGGARKERRGEGERNSSAQRLAGSYPQNSHILPRRRGPTESALATHTRLV